MKLAIMQPYFLPYLGYYQLIDYADAWVYFDIVKFNKKSWMSRNRIQHPDPEKTWQYINVPIRKHAFGTLIRDIRISTRQDWPDSLLRKLEPVYDEAPHFDEVMALLKTSLGQDADSFPSFIAQLNQAVLGHLGIRHDHELCSKLDLDLPESPDAGQWALEIADQLGCSQYVNPPGGAGLFTEEQFNERGIELAFLVPRRRTYDQGRDPFVADLSIVDVLMWNSAEQSRALLGEFDIRSQSELVSHDA